MGTTYDPMPTDGSTSWGTWLRDAIDDLDDRGYVVAPAPTGVAATDKSNLDALTSTANRVVQLRAGTYVYNPLAAFADGVVLRGWPNLATTLKLAVQAVPFGITLGDGGGLDGIVLDGDRASAIFSANEYEYLVKLADGCRVERCRFQNILTSAVGAQSGFQVETPAITSLTTSTAGGSLSTGVLHYYRVTATTASGETQPSAEASVTTGAGSNNSNTLRWRKIDNATGYKVYHSTTAANQWKELLLTTIGSGSTVVYVHTTGSGATTNPPMVNTSGGSSITGPILSNAYVVDNEFTACRQTGIYVQANIVRCHFSRNHFTLMERNCVKLQGAGSPGGFSVSIDNKVEENTCDYSGLEIDQWAFAIELWNGVYHTIISGNHVIGPADGSDLSTGLFIAISLGGNADNTVVVGNTVRKSNPNGRNDLIEHGIENNGNAGCTIEGNVIVGCNIGISVGRVDYSSGGSDHSSVIGNRIKECHDHGIQITEGSGHTVQGNTLIDCGWRYIFLNGFEKPTLANAVVGNTCFIASNNQSAEDPGGTMSAIYIRDSGRQTITGNICGPLPAVATPGTPTVTPQGTSGGTTYSYKVTAVNEYGETVGSATGTTATGNATLTGANFNRITFTRINSATGYRIYRTAGAGGAGYIGRTAEEYGATPTFDDTGISADTNLTAPVTGTTAGTSTVGLIGLYFQGTTLIEASIINGNRWDGSPPSGSSYPDYAVVLDGAVDYTQVVNNFAQNYDVGFIQQTGTPGASPNYVQFNTAPGIPMPHAAGLKFSDIVRRSDEVQRLAGGVYLADDFTGGLLTTGNIGDLGWQFLNGTAPIHVAAEASHSGIIRLDTSATTSTEQYFWCGGGSTGNVGQILPADWFHFVAMFRLNASDANTTFRIGLASTAAGVDPSTHGLFIEKVGADTSWFGVTRASSAQTRTSALSTVSAAQWVKATIRRKNSTTIGFSISTSFAPDNGTEATLTATIPTGALVPFCMIANLAAASKTADIDYIEVNVGSMNR